MEVQPSLRQIQRAQDFPFFNRITKNRFSDEEEEEEKQDDSLTKEKEKKNDKKKK